MHLVLGRIFAEPLDKWRQPNAIDRRRRDAHDERVFGDVSQNVGAKLADLRAPILRRIVPKLHEIKSALVPLIPRFRPLVPGIDGARAQLYGFGLGLKQGGDTEAKNQRRGTKSANPMGDHWAKHNSKRSRKQAAGSEPNPGRQKNSGPNNTKVHQRTQNKTEEDILCELRENGPFTDLY
jgi:hypothetical protein